MGPPCRTVARERVGCVHYSDAEFRKYSILTFYCSSLGVRKQCFSSLLKKGVLGIRYHSVSAENSQDPLKKTAGKCEQDGNLHTTVESLILTPPLRSQKSVKSQEIGDQLLFRQNGLQISPACIRAKHQN